jgi:hypothetical protein
LALITYHFSFSFYDIVLLIHREREKKKKNPKIVSLSEVLNIVVLMFAYGRDTMPERLDVRPFASISRSSNQETSSVAVNPQPAVPPPPSYV